MFLLKVLTERSKWANMSTSGSSLNHWLIQQVFSFTCQLANVQQYSTLFAITFKLTPDISLNVISIYPMWNMLLIPPYTWSSSYGSEQDTAIDFQYALKLYCSQLIWIPELSRRCLRFPPQPDNTLRPRNVYKSQRQTRYLQARASFGVTPHHPEGLPCF